MDDFEGLGREYVSDVVGQPWTEVAAALNRLELDPKRVDNPASRDIGRRVWEAHAEAHRRAAEWWARNRPGVVVDPGTSRSLDGTTTRCILRGACGQAESCYCARTMWTRGRVPDYQVVDEPLVEAVTESEVWKRQAAISYVNEEAVRGEMAKGPVRLAPEVAAQLGESAPVVGYDPARPEVAPVVYEHVVGPVHPYCHWPVVDEEYQRAARAAADPKTFRQEREGVWRDGADPEPGR